MASDPASPLNVTRGEPQCAACSQALGGAATVSGSDGFAWHKDCFNCIQCDQALSLDGYYAGESAEETGYRSSAALHARKLQLPIGVG